MSRYIGGDALDAFAARVLIGDDCWEWTGGHNDRGYGQLSLREKGLVYTHRYAYELLVGAIPAGLSIDHLCRNPGCCNPSHLEPVSTAENVRRGWAAKAAEGRKPKRGAAPRMPERGDVWRWRDGRSRGRKVVVLDVADGVVRIQQRAYKTKVRLDRFHRAYAFEAAAAA